MNTETVKTGTVSTGTITRLPGDTATQPLAAVPTQGQPPATPAAAAAKPPRADGVMLLAVYHFMLAGLLLLATMGLAIPTVITAIVGVVEDSDALIATGILGLLAAVEVSALGAGSPVFALRFSFHDFTSVFACCFSCPVEALRFSFQDLAFALACSLFWPDAALRFSFPDLP